jgi:hypothetical protein
VLVPVREPYEFVCDLRALAENISRERCIQWDPHPPKAVHREVDVAEVDVEVTIASTPEVEAIASTPKPAQVTPPAGETMSEVRVTNSPSTDAGVNVGPAWHIPMTQALQELPSQLDVDWPDSVALTPTPSNGTTRNLVEELDAVGASQPVDTPIVIPLSAFVEVSQIAQKAVTDATSISRCDVS